MAMTMPMGGTPWLDQPVLLHSSRKDSCSSTLSPAECVYRRGYWRYWYQADHVYALATVYFCCATVGLFMLIHIFSRLSTPRSRSSNPAVRRSVAIFRYISYKGYQVRSLRWFTPTLGFLLLIAAGTVFFFGLSLGPKPYYWPNTRKKSFGNSPPLATRTGWMALALVPFTLALGSKSNFITLLTGVPHEKLQILHQWTAYAMFVLALVHTFPFIVFHIWKHDMVMVWKTSVVYWTGVAAIIPQAYLTFMSFGPIRNRYYEFFKSTHIMAAVLFMVFFFIHCDFRLSSWDYFIASGAVYLSTLTYSYIKTYLVYGFSHRAVVTLLPSGILKIQVPVHPGGATHSKAAMRMSWHPGQHVFIRFLALGFHAFTAHPFTICSLPPSRRKGEPCELVLYVQPANGFTARLASLAQRSPGISVPILLDGPYGGLTINSFAQFDKAVIIAGGSGAGFTLPIIEDILCHKKHEEKGQGHITRIQVVLATRSHEARAWYVQEIEYLVSKYQAAEYLQVDLHVTHNESGSQSPNSSVDEKGIERGNLDGLGREMSLAPITAHTGRPNLRQTIEEATATPGETVGIAACGPAGMMFDVREASASAQAMVLQGRGAQEVYLHCEGFSW